MGSSLPRVSGSNRHERRKLAALQRQAEKSSRLARRFQSLESLEKRELLSSIQVTIDYSFDTNGFFNDPLRQELMQAAANMVVRDFTDTLDAINPDANNTWTADFTHPGTGADESVANRIIAANEIVIFAGGRNLGGPLGEGGPGGFSISFFDQAFANAVVGRGEPGALGAQASRTDFASWGGSVTFDNTATWHFGFSTDGLDAGENDFLSVAMHEVAHLLGFGTSASFQNLINFGNATFTGALSVAANGGNAVPLADAGHWQNGIQSGGQEAAMDPNLTVGTRKMMTPLDNAGLDDLGWDLVPAIGVVTNTNDSGPGSLRQAILDLNAGIVPVDTITFNINVNDPGFIDIDSALPLGDADADVFRINLESELPDIIRPNSSINGESQSFYLASDLNVFGPEIWIRGGAIPNGSSVNGLTLDAANIFIHHLVITGFDSGFSAGIFLTNNADDSTVERNYLGVDPTGLTAEANDNGVFVDGADNVRILGDRSETPQVISGNNNQGIFIDNDAIGALIQGNFIGVGVDGTTAIANFQHGVSIRSGSDHFVGVNPAIEAFQDGNTIAGNAIEGVHLEGPVTGVTIAGNRIGIGDNGVAVPNQFGISIFGAGATGNFIGVENVAAGSNIISGNSSEGVRILAGATGNTVVRNFIGTNENGDAAVPNGGLAGVLVEASDGNAIGTADNGNVISGNDGDGVLLRAFDGDGADGNTIVGNLIGVAADGFTGLGNGARGVAIFNSSGNSVGGDGDQSFSNVISANAQEGVAIFDEDFEGETLTATNNTILNNFIGIDRDEAADGLGNGGAGVRIEAGDGNIIGGFINGEAGTLGGNVIVDNAGSGIELVRSADGNQILGNFIGVTRNNLAAGNFGDGVAIRDSSGNLVGIDAVGTENVIGGNTGTGVSIIDFLPIVGVAHAGPANFNVVLNNFIGTDNSRTLDLGNVGEGIYISAGSNRVGQVNTNGQTVFPNTIAFNGEAGEPGIAVSILEAAAFAINNSLRGNTIFNNSGIAIDLADVNSGQRFDGVTPNDFLDGDGGPNTQQNFPVITTANATGPSLTVAGTLSAGIGSGQYFIDIYANGRHIGHTLPTVDNAGFANFNVTLPNANVTAGQTITATATQVTNQSTSEHSAAFLATADIVPFDVVVESKSFFSNAVNPFFDVFIDAPPGVVAAIAGYNIGLRISPFGAGVTLLAPIAGNDPLIAGTPDNPTVVPQVLTVADDVSAGAVAIVDGKDFFRVPISIAPGTVGTFDVTIDPVLFQLVDGGGVELDASLFNLVNGTITISTPPLEVSIGDPAAVTEGNAGTQTVTFPVTLSANPTSAVTVTVSTANNTAVAGGVSSTGANDYVAKTQTFTFNPGGALTQNFTVTINGDTVKELNETFFANITGTTGPVTSITDGQGVGTINDNDTLPAILIDDPTFAEGDTGNTTGNFLISLTAPHASSNVTVQVTLNTGSAVQGVDFVDQNNVVVTFLPGETQKSFPVQIVGDFTVEANETFTATLASPSATATIGDNSGTGTITDNDTRIVTISDAQVVEGDESQVDMVFTVALNVPRNDGNVSVTLNTNTSTAVQNVDFVDLVNQVITFLPGETSKQVIVKVNGDFAVEGNETFVAALSNFVGVDGAAAGADTAATGTIIDNDTRVVTISDAQVVEGDESQVDMVFTVALNVPRNDGNVSVTLNTNTSTAVQNVDFVDLVNQVITFLPGETSKQVIVKVNGDFAVEGDETFVAALSNFVGVDGAAAGADTVATGTIIDNDTRVVTISDAQVSEGDAGQTDMVFTVALNVPRNDGNVSVTLNTNTSTAVQNVDFVDLVNQVITFLPGETSKQVIVKVIGDVLIEGDETFLALLSGVTGADLNGPGADTTGVGTILDDDTRTLSISDAVVVEGDTVQSDLIFTVTLNQAHPTSNVTVTVNTNTVTAIQNVDFVDVVDQVITFLPGETSKQVIVKVNGDFDIEGDETLTATLSAATGAQIVDSSGTGTITNDDTRVITIADAQVVEGNTGETDIVFTISLNGPRNDGDVTALFSTSTITATSGIDFDDVNNLLVTFTPGQTQRQVVVKVNGDTAIEPDETFSASLSSVVGADDDVADGARLVAVGTILNDDIVIPVVSIADASVTEGDTGTKNLTLTISLSVAHATSAVSGTFTTIGTGSAAPNTDFANQSSVAWSIPQGQTSTTINVPIVGEFLIETDETFNVVIEGIQNATAGDTTAVATITNDDNRTITIADAQLVEGNSGSANMVFTITVSNPRTDGAVTGTFTTIGTGSATTGTDFTNRSAIAWTIAANATSTTITVPILGDTTVEPDETFNVILEGIIGADGTAAGSDTTAVGTIVNDDVPSISISDVTLAEGNGAGTTAFTFNVTLSANPSAQVQVTAVTADGTATLADNDYQQLTGTPINFLPGGPLTQQVTVLVNRDAKFEPNETFLVNLTGLTGPATIADGAATGTILNDDVVRLSINDIQVAETNTGSFVANLTVTLDTASFQTVTVNFATQDDTATSPSDFIATSGTLTFLPGEVSKTIPITINGDVTVEPNESFVVNLTNPSSGAVTEDFQGQVLIQNDDFVPPVVSIGNGLIVELDSGETGVAVAISLNAAHPTSAVSGTFTTIDTGSATPGLDFIARSTVAWTIPQGSTFVVISVQTLGDFLIEGNETFEIVIEDIQNATAGDTTGVATIQDNDTRTVSIANASLTEGNAGSADMTFTISVNQARTDGPVTGTFTTIGTGSATPGVDFTNRSGIAWTIPANATSTTITVPILGDTTVEPDETFNVVLEGIVGADGLTAVGGDTTAVGTIVNDDVPSISISDVALAEGNGSGTTAFTFNVTISADPSAQVQVTAITIDGSATLADGDYQQLTGTPINFLPGGPLTQQVTVLVNGDATFEPDETFLVNLTGLTGPATITDGQATGNIANDDGQPVVSISGPSSVVEGTGVGGVAAYTIALTNPSFQTITVVLNTADGSANAGGDFTGVTGQTVTFTPGQTSQQVNVQITGDAVDENDETFSASITAPVNATINAGASSVTTTIIDDDGAPTLSINDVTQVETNSGATAFVFTVTLSGSSAVPITVNFATDDGTATLADGDYQSNAGTLTFNPGGPATQTVTVMVNGDTTFEPNENFVVNLSAATNATIADGQGNGSITNDDNQPTVSINDVTVVEGNAGNTAMTFTVSLSNPSSQTITVQTETRDGGTALGGGVDYLNNALLLSFAPGQVAQTFTVQVVGDTTFELDESFPVLLAGATNATVLDANGVGTITNDDAVPAISITDAAVTEGNAGTTTATFTVSLTNASAFPISVQFNTADGTATLADSDYQSNAGTLNFPANSTSSQTITVLVNGDTKFEANQNFLVDLLTPANATIADSQAVGTINNDDARPTITITGASANEGDALTFNLTLSNASDETVTVQATVNDGTATTADNDYTDINGQVITFNPGVTAQSFVVQSIEDTKFEADQTISVALSGAVNATGTSGSPATGTIVNDDARPTITIAGASANEGDALTFNLTLSNASDETVTVQATVNDGTATTADNDYIDINGQVITFNPGVTAQSFVVQSIEDTKFEADQTISVELSGATNASGTSGSPATGTITNDDARPTITITGASANEGDALTFNLTLSNASDETVTVQATVNDGTATTADNDYTDINGQVITFNPGVTAQSFVVQSIEDTKFEADQTISVALSGATNATGTSGSPATGTIVNDDARPTITITGASASEGDALTFNLSLSNLSDEQVSVLASTLDGTAAAGSDFTGATNQAIVFAPGASAAQLVVASTEDGTVETTETFTVALSGAINAGGISGSPATGTIIDDDGVTTISVNDVSINEGNAGSTKLDFTITLSAPSSQTITVLATITDGTATSEDYTAGTPVLVTFTPGSTTRTVSASVLGDTKFEADQTFNITLSDPTNAVIADGAGVATILNDDARPTVTIRNANNNEGNQLTFGIELSHATDETVTMTATTNDGSATDADGDYVFFGDQPISVAPGTLLQTVTVQTNEDDKFEADETLTVLLKNLVGGVFGDDTGVGTIFNDDAQPAVSIADKTVVETDGVSVELLQLTLSNPSAFPVSVVVNTANGAATAGSDFDAIVGRTVTFNPGQTSITTPVNILGDTIRENNEAFLVNLSSPVGGTIDDGQAIVTIQDNDPLPTISINDVTQNEGTGGTTAFTFTVTLSNGSQSDVLVTLQVNDGSATVANGDYIDGGTLLTFQNGGPLSQTFTVLVNGDATFEANETFTVALSSPVNAVIAAGDAGVGTGTILNDDGLTVSISDGQSVEGNPGDNRTIVFTVSLSAPPTELMTVNLSSFNGTATTADDDYLPLDTFLIFTPGGPTSQQVSVQVVGDDFFEFDETLEVQITNVAGSGATVADGTGVGTIINDDAQPTVSIGDVSRPENFGTTSFALGFPVTLSKPIKVPVTVSVAFSNGTAIEGSDWTDDFGSSFVFVPGGSTSVLFPVRVIDDNIFELDETVIATITSATNATIADGSAVGTIVNDDAPPTVTISNASVQEGNNGESNDLVFNVTLSHPSHAAIGIGVIFGGTATFGTDYNGTGATILAGQTTGTIRLSTIGDNRFELDETVTIDPVLVFGQAVLPTGLATGTILNDDNAPVITIGNASVLEGDSGEITGLSFPVSISGETDLPATITLDTLDQTATGSGANRDYDGGPITITFTPGGPTTFNAVYTVRGDDVFEGNETFALVATLPVINATVSGLGLGVGTIIEDEPAPTVSISDASVLEDSGFSVAQLLYTVTLSSAVSVPVTVTVVATEGTADSPEDFVAGTVTFTINPGDPLTKQVAVLVEHDNIFELDETVVATITSATNAAIADGSAVGTIVNDDAVPSVTISNASVQEGNNGESNDLVFNVTLSHPSHEAIGIGVVLGGSAVSESDYTDQVGAFIPAGATTGTVRVRTIGDNRFELDETVTIDPFLVIGQAVLPTGVAATGTILNDDNAPLITIGNGSVLEGAAGETTTLRIPVSISGETDVPITVTLDTFDGTATGSGANRDYDNDGLPLILTFTPGGPTAFDVLHTVRGDDLVEGNETFTLFISDAPNSIITGSGVGVGTIIDDDLPTIRISDVTLDELSLLVPSRNFNFLVELSQPAAQTITVDFTTVDGSATTADGDYLAKSGTITFTPGSQFATVSVTVFTDTKFELDQDFFVNLSNPVGATFADPQGKGTILNDDQRPTISIDDAGSVTEGNLGTAPALFTIRLSNPSDEIVSVNASTADGSATSADNDYTPVSNLPIVFNPGQTQLSAAAFVRGDTKFESDQTFRMVLTGAANSSGITDSEGVATIVNDDSRPTVTITDAGNITEGNSGTTPALFNVTLSNASDEVVTVEVATQDGGATVADNDYQAVSTTLTFNPTGLLTQTVTVQVNGDAKFEPAETFRLNVQATGNATIADGSGQAVIVNDDSNVVLAVDRIVVNDGAAQRSNIDRIEVQFTADANIQALIDSGQIVDAIKLRNTSTGQDVVLTVSRFQFSAANRSLRIDLTTDGFGGAVTTILADGRHQLRLDTNLITVAGDGANKLVDGDGNADGIHRFNFHRYMGDFNGDGRVDVAGDVVLFNAHYLSVIGQARYDAIFDFDGNGRIDAVDLLTLRRRLNTMVAPAIE